MYIGRLPKTDMIKTLFGFDPYLVPVCEILQYIVFYILCKIKIISLILWNFLTLTLPCSPQL
jgi:hypothetical protein